VDGVSVLVSPHTGPATVGVVRPEIVLPRWALALADGARRLMLAHEREHLRAGDPRLLFAGTLLAMALPWNLPLWWQLRRLRLAVELDCDARVLRAGGNAATYGNLLLEVGRRRAGVPVLSAALAEGKSFLERRIGNLAESAGVSVRRVVGLAAVATGLLALAVCTPDPFGPSPHGGDPAPVQVPAEGTADAPRFTPYTEPPRLTNPDEVGAALARLYPPLLRDAGIEGTVHVWAFVDHTGAVTRTRLDEGETHEALRQAALRVMESARFEPARNQGRPVSAWVRLPVRFAVDGGGIEARPTVKDSTTWMKAVRIRVKEEADSARERLSGEVSLLGTERPAPPILPDTPRVALAERPTFTPYDTAPQLRNRREVGAALERFYPPLLRDAGVGGTVSVWFFIGADGRVLQTRMHKASGHDALDEAALAVAGVMEFRPASLKGEAVPVWVAMPITFRAKPR
ncbi:MAG TPA: M56 family metallopeptidase, partial [Longimicrobiales bacterium]|nr:M56 family metallopeptidase [Longimicrobiales bacterium]